MLRLYGRKMHSGRCPGRRFSAMNQKVKEHSWLLTALFCMVYFTSYITRGNYAAVIPEVMSDLALTKSQAGLAVTFSFISYGLGQPFVGWLGDRVPPKYIITTGLIGTALCNLLTSFQSAPAVIAVLWCCNGFFQAMMWPPLLRIIAETNTPEGYVRTVVNVTTVSCIGTMMIYLVAPVLIRLSSWRLVLIVPAILALIMATVWQVFLKAGRTAGASPTAKRDSADGNGLSIVQLILLSGMPMIFTGILLQGLLRDGITTWMTTYISEAFNLGTGVSILSGAVLPLFSVICIRISARFLKLCKGNEVMTAGVFFGISSASCLLLYVFFDSIAMSLVLMSLISGCAHGINQMLVCTTPGRYSRYGRVASMSGIINAFTYVGSALSAYGFAALADMWGWKPMVLVWFACAMAGLALCVASLKRWKKFIV